MDEDDFEPLSAVERAALDAALGAYVIEPPSEALRQRILARAPKPRARLAWRHPAMWWSGAGLAAACAIGIIVGVELGGSIQDRDSEAAAALAPVAVFGQPVDGAQG